VRSRPGVGGSSPGDYIHALRRRELEAALAGVPDSVAPVLEIGGGDGYVAALLAERWDSVRSVDIAAAATTFFPVEIYDGRTLPFDDATFGLVYSSHVMEHIAHFEVFQDEIARVLRPGGIAVHLMPSGAWRWWTLLAHYPAAVRTVLGLGGDTAISQPLAWNGPRRSAAWWLRRIAMAPAHGEHYSALGELAGFSRARWMARFRQCGWTVLDARPVGYFYTGYVLRGGQLPFDRRRTLGAWMGSGSNVFRVAPPPR
jgi:SAM-dependent methyltransferase